MAQPIRTCCLALVTAAGLLFTSASATAQAPAPSTPPAREIRDARELAPDALLGVWKADVAASTYASAAPREQLRVFQLTEDGKLMVIFLTLNARGVQSGGHWAVQLDGAPGEEYHSSRGSIPYNVITLTMRDPRNYDLTVTRGGVLDLTGGYVLSEDGSTLTYNYGEGQGATSIVYRRWEALD